MSWGVRCGTKVFQLCPEWVQVVKVMFFISQLRRLCWICNSFKNYCLGRSWFLVIDRSHWYQHTVNISAEIILLFVKSHIIIIIANGYFIYKWKLRIVRNGKGVFGYEFVVWTRLHCQDLYVAQIGFGWCRSVSPVSWKIMHFSEVSVHGEIISLRWFIPPFHSNFASKSYLPRFFSMTNHQHLFVYVYETRCHRIVNYVISSFYVLEANEQSEQFHFK